MTFKFSQAVSPITDLKNHSRDIVKQLKESGRPILITQRGRGAAVMESIESYEKRQEYYESIEGILAALQQAEKGDLHDHKEALKILETF
ncbi:MAG: type II toxin-antitoxin system Phd/YefM family antitoxin [Deltaproteobacteria bacterium]|nr:type II toxin-antitoxin system Phd/YefM family antitoxin [Deltaproteobacteria bacterium]MBI4373756.1 type II toxin-antitoxin system Phd/YefM family antitoxin [Deltaproteobacteria bacterium]